MNNEQPQANESFGSPETGLQEKSFGGQVLRIDALSVEDALNKLAAYVKRHGVEVRVQLHKPTKVGRNSLCPCKSGKKYKKCCQPKGVIPIDTSDKVEGLVMVDRETLTRLDAENAALRQQLATVGAPPEADTSPEKPAEPEGHIPPVVHAAPVGAIGGPSVASPTNMPESDIQTPTPGASA